MNRQHGFAPGCERGFTLVELMAALVVLGFVVVMLSQGLRFGVRAASRVDAERWQDLLATEDALRHLVEQADPGTYPEPAGLRGTAATLSLLTELPGGGGPPRRADVSLAAKDGRLVLRWRPHRHVQAFGPPPVPAEIVLAEAVESVEFGYFGRGSASWQPGWAADSLPGYVRLTIRFTSRSHLHWPPIIIATSREPIEE